ncbi:MULTISPECIES: hypothetical protein [Petrotoga]|nr:MULTISPECIES: hypothetical protein [Petrotoga]
MTEEFNDILLWILLGGIFLFFFTVVAGKRITQEAVVLTMPN